MSVFSYNKFFIDKLKAKLFPSSLSHHISHRSPHNRRPFNIGHSGFWGALIHNDLSVVLCHIK